MNVVMYTTSVFSANLPFQTHDPTQPANPLKLKILDPLPTQPNPWVNPTHGQLWNGARRLCGSFEEVRYRRYMAYV